MKRTHKLAVLLGVLSTLAALGAYVVFTGDPGLSSINSTPSSSAPEILSGSPLAPVLPADAAGRAVTRAAASLAPTADAPVASSSSGKTKDTPKPPKDKGPAEPPPPAEPPADPPVVPEEPPVTPEDPPVVPEEPPIAPEPEDPPAPPAAPGAVAAVSCVSGDMADIITFAPPSEGAVTCYSLMRSSTEDGEYSLVTTATADARSFTVPVTVTGTFFYRIGVTGPGGEGPVSSRVSNAQVLITAEVPPSGATLRASNGEFVLALPEGAFATTTTVTVSEVAGSPRGNLIALAGVFDITPSGPLGAPATLSVAYSSPVAHHEVSAALLASAGLMTYDEGEGAWMNGASGITADGTYLTGTLSHFSYWTGATIQPHGTSTTAYCSSGGICHDLSTYPGSTVRYSSRDSQVCYNCHGNTDAALPPAGANPTSPNIQAELFQVSGQVRPAGASTHPVATGGLYCTACHDPHADPTASPGLLKAWDPTTGTYIQGGAGATPGNTFCWTCHGAIKNRRIDYLVPGYYTASGGDKKTGFNGAHSGGLSATTTRVDTAVELGRGVLRRTQIVDGGVQMSGSGAFPKLETPSTLYSYNYNTTAGIRGLYDDDTASWVKFYGVGSTGSTVAIDLGATTAVDYVTLQFSQYAVERTQVVQVQASADGSTWTTLATQGVLGTDLAQTVTIPAPAQYRHIRFVFKCQVARDIVVNEITLFGQPSSGIYDVRIDLARKSTYGGGVIRWQAATPASTAIQFYARASSNGGSSWTPWSSVTNGGSLTQIPANGNLSSALLEVRAVLTSAAVGATPSVDWIEVTTSRGAISGTQPVWTGSGESECASCHRPHGSSRQALVATDPNPVCLTCHQAAFGGSYYGAGDYATSVHRNVKCVDCHGSHGTQVAGGTGVYAYLLSEGRGRACFSCHPNVETASEGGLGVARNLARHDLDAYGQELTGSRIRCGSCHTPHSPSGLVNPENIASPYTKYITDPTSIPTQEYVVYAAEDTVLDSTAGNQALNYGASTQGTLDSARRLLLYFDLSSLPPGATILHAELVLWPTAAANAGGTYTIYPVTHDWVEGTGTGTLNTNGATWLEWRYGDNANTGDVAGGDWVAPGGDMGTPTATNNNYQYSGTVCTALVDSLWRGVNNGMLVVAGGTTPSFGTYLRENPTQQYRPKLRITCQTGPAVGPDVPDGVDFCLKCHDGTMPVGQRGQSMINIATEYAHESHGSGTARGIESQVGRYDAGNGSLKSPYYYGMPALPCTECHDPHGSPLANHLKQTVNNTTWSVGTPTFSYYRSFRTAGYPSQGQFCRCCHNVPPAHGAYANDVGCNPCHYGGHSWSTY